MSKYSETTPFVIIALFAFWYIVFIHPMNFSPKLNLRNTLNNQSHSTRSKAFSWSNNMITESSDFSLIISSRSAMFSPIYLPVTHPRWSVWIISGKAILILSASVFERILKSVFNKDIGLQFLISSRLPFLYNNFVIANYCQYGSWLCSNPFMMTSRKSFLIRDQYIL